MAHEREHCFEKYLTRTDVDRNLELPMGALFLPADDGIFILRNQAGKPYRLRAPTRGSGRRSLTGDWKDFAAENNLGVGQKLRMNRLGHEYEVEVEVKLFGIPISWERR